MSNFFPDRLADICSFAEIAPMVNQVETHPLCQQKEARKTMDKYKVQQEAWSPFAEGREGLFSNETLLNIAANHSKTIAQITLRFLLQSKVVTIPQSKVKERMAENIEIFDFSLTDDEMKRIQILDLNKSAFLDHSKPETVDLIKSLKV